MMSKQFYNINQYWISSADSSKDCYPSSIVLRKAEVLVTTGMWDKATNMYQQVLAAGERLGADPERAESLYRLGEVFRLKSEYPEALEHLSKAMHLYQELRDGGGTAKTVGAMGGVYGEQGDYQKAIECFSERKNWAEKTGDKMELGIAWGNLGVIYAEQKMLDQALECYQKQKALAEYIGDLVGLSFAYGNSGNIYIHKSQYETAIDCFQKQMDLSKRIGDKRALCAVSCNLGLLFKKQAKMEQSLEYFNQAIRSASEIGYSRVVSQAYGNIATVYQNLGDLEQTEKCLNEYLKLNREVNDKPGVVIALGKMSKLKERLGDIEKAKALLSESLDISRDNKFEGLLPILLIMMGELLLEQNAYSDVAKIAGEAYQVAQKQNNQEQLETVRILQLLSEIGQGNISAVAGLIEIAKESIYDEVRLGACMGLYKHTGENIYLKAAGELSDKLYAETREVEYKIRMDQLRATQPKEMDTTI